MKKFIIFIISLFLISAINIGFSSFCPAKILSGNIDKDEYLGKTHTVVDGVTGNPVSGAEISVPTEGIFTKTNNSGQFKLDASFKSPVILSVQADGYKPFSLTINEGKINSPLMIVINKLSINENVIDSDIHHLGDDNYSEKSANAGDFKLSSEGPEFSRKFFVEKLTPDMTPVLKIGTIIGIDTNLAHKIEGKNKIKAYSTPLQVYLNSKKIAEIRINGDNQEISLPKALLKPNSYNTILLETGVNQQAATYIDYDDVEFMNVMIIYK